MLKLHSIHRDIDYDVTPRHGSPDVIHLVSLGPAALDQPCRIGGAEDSMGAPLAVGVEEPPPL